MNNIPIQKRKLQISDAISIFSLLVSVGAVIFSIISYSDNKLLSVEGFNRNYRPYVTAANFAYTNQKTGLDMADMRCVAVKDLNAPAFVTYESVSYYIRSGDSDHIFYNKNEYHNAILYPLDKASYNIYSDYHIINDSLAISLFPKRLIRKVRLEYTWLDSGKDNYYYESESMYDSSARQFLPLRASAN